MSTQTLDGCPTTLAAGAGNAFVGLGCIHYGGHLTGETLKVSPSGGTPTRIVNDAPQLAFVDNSLWAAGPQMRGGPNVLAKIDPTTGDVVSSLHFRSDQLLETVAGDSSGVWVVADEGTTAGGATSTLFEFSSSGKRIMQSIPLDGIRPKGASSLRMIRGMAVGEGAVWLIDAGYSNQGIIVDAYIIRISQRTGKVTGEVSVGYTNELAVGDGAVWTSNKNDLGLRIDAKTLKVTQLHAKPFEPFAVGEGGVWYLDRHIVGSDVAVKRLDPKTLKPNLTIQEPSFPSTVGLNPVLDETSHTVWIVSDDKNQLTQIALG